jgi:GNAT superfamily N-acetyltransferase
MNLEIRPATEKDLPRLLTLYGQLDMDSGESLSLAKAQKLFRRMKDYPDYRIYIALEKGFPVGTFALLIMDNLGHGGKPSAILENVIVRKDFRSRGIGRQMVAWALSLCSEKGCYKLSLSSNRKRLDAHRFYEKLGFQQQGISFSVFWENEDRV